MRALILLLSLILVAAALSCDSVKPLPEFPVTPEIQEATLFWQEGDVVAEGDMFISGAGDTLRPGDPLLQRVRLRWSLPAGESADEYKVYVGLYYDYGFGILDTLGFYASAQEESLIYVDYSLAQRDSLTCALLGMCDSLYTYSYFRVSAVRDGSEGPSGFRFFPSW